MENRTVNIYELEQWSKTRPMAKEELAILSGVGTSTIYKIFAGYLPSRKVGVKIANAMAVDFDTLFPLKASSEDKDAA